MSEPNYEPENADDNAGDNDSSDEIDNKKPAQDADGNYVYLITVDGVQTEIKTALMCGTILRATRRMIA